MSNPNKKYSVLFVDDEKRILTALKSIFRREYNVYTALGGEEALDVLSKHDIDVIVSDQRMPYMLGNELLAKVHKLYPRTMRLLLTGFMDKEAIIKTINEGEIYRFINKPWRNEDIHAIIAEAALASEFAVEEISVTDSATKAKGVETDNVQPNNKVTHTINHVDASILMMGSTQELRNQIRDICRKHNINVYGSTSIPQAIGVIAARPQVGVTIMEMPVNTDEATQTISLLKENRPELVSIVLTDETDAETAVELINSGQVFRYLPKPLESDKLEKIIGQAFIRHQTLKNNEQAQQRYRVARSNTFSSTIKELFSGFSVRKPA